MAGYIRLMYSLRLSQEEMGCSTKLYFFLLVIAIELIIFLNSLICYEPGSAVNVGVFFFPTPFMLELGVWRFRPVGIELWTEVIINLTVFCLLAWPPVNHCLIIAGKVTYGDMQSPFAANLKSETKPSQLIPHSRVTPEKPQTNERENKQVGHKVLDLWMVCYRTIW